MELRQLRYFREVVRLGSFRRAAERLLITQPALTKSIRALEDELGVQLLERRASGVITTQFGSILVNCADSVAIDIVRATAEIEALNGKSAGVVRVGGMTTVMQWILPGVVKDLVVSNPDLRIVSTISLLNDVVNQIAEGEIDVGLCTLFPWHRSDAIVGERLLRDEICIVGDQNHPLLRKGVVAVADLLDYRWVLPGDGDGWRRRLFEIYREAQLPDPRVAIETGSAALMARLVEGTRMLSFLPRRLIAADDVFRGLRPIETRFDWPEFEVFLAYRKAGALLPSTRLFIEALRSFAGSKVVQKLRLTPKVALRRV
jgi:DNA-binding transcriptional LysR family regulator